MDRIKACEQKFSELFGGTPNAGEGNDPELMQILQRFIFGQVSFTGTLDDAARELITCVVLSTYQTLPQLRAHAAAALRVGVSPLMLREAVYQCMPMIGCPKTLNAVAVIDEVFTAQGIALPLENAASVSEDDRIARGRAIQMPLYGEEVKQSLRTLPEEFAQAVPEFLTGYYFGDFYTRKGLTIKMRELLSFVVLAALGDCQNPLRAHIHGCLRAGNTAEDLYTALLQALPYTGFPRALAAFHVLKEELEK